MEGEDVGSNTKRKNSKMDFKELNLGK